MRRHPVIERRRGRRSCTTFFPARRSPPDARFAARLASAAKTAKTLGEDGKVAVRNIRKTALDKIKKMKKAIGDDAAKDAEDEVQKVVKKYEGEVGELVAQREKEIMGN